MTPPSRDTTSTATPDSLPARPARDRATLVASISPVDRGILVRIGGAADILGAEQMRLTFTQVIACRPPVALLDLAAMTFLSSLGMGQLVALRRDLGRWGGRVKIACCPPAIQEALNVARLTDFFEFHASVEEALSVV